MAITPVLRLAVVALSAWFAAAASASAASGELELERVVLSTGGVGYFEYAAEIDGDGTLTLELDRDQVDDVLKSIVVFDGAGHVGSASLPGEEPLAQYFRNLPFGPDALGSPITLLQALQGARVRVVGQRAVEGRLLQVVPEQALLPNGGGVITRHRLSILTDQGIAQAVFEDSESVTFVDAEVQAQVDGALAAVADNRNRERRSITVRIQGEGPRTVTVGYVVGAPLWKASYRATLPDAGAETGQLQGWAHLENLSGQDWDGVDLTLVSGNPVTFRQAIYRSYLVARPEVPVEVLGRILPRLDEGAVAMSEQALGGDGATGNLGELEEMKVEGDYSARASSDMAFAAAPLADAVQEPRVNLIRADMAQVGTEAATQVLFHIADPVTLARGESLMVPIIAQAVPMQRVVVYQPATHPRHPVASVRIVNDGAAGLAPGVMTLYDRGANGMVDFVGDARLATLSAGDNRLVGYALDQKTLIDMEPGYDQTIGKGKIHDGILELMVVERQTSTYRIKTLADEPRSIVIEHPRQPGWTLVEPAGLEATATATDYRIPVEAKAGSETTIAVVLELTQWQQLSLADLGEDQLTYYVDSGAFDDAVRDALAGLMSLRRDIGVKQARIDALDTERGRLFDDQTRIRANLYEVPQGSDLERQYLDTLTAQEATLVAIEQERGTAAAELAALERELADRIAKLEL